MARENTEETNGFFHVVCGWWLFLVLRKCEHDPFFPDNCLSFEA